MKELLRTKSGEKRNGFLMNIFALHHNPRKAARWHLDRHVVKMILETCQLLYTAHWVSLFPELLQCRSAIALSKAQKTLPVPAELADAPNCSTTGTPGYRPCHIHHPCAVWTRATRANYMWLVELGLELVREYRFRFENKHHSCEEHMVWLAAHVPHGIPDEPRTPFAKAITLQWLTEEEQRRVGVMDPVMAYRLYYRTVKRDSGLIQYTARAAPHWLSPR